MFKRTRCTCYFIGLLLILHASLYESVTPQYTVTSIPNNAPIEFPKNESEYPFMHNRTILEALASQTSNNDTEVDDLRHGGQYGGQFVNISHFENSKTLPEALGREVKNTNATNNKWDAELIEDGSKTEETKISRNNKSVPIKSRIPDSYGSKMPTVQGQLVAILAGVFVLVAVVGYIGLLYWKRFFENRHGNREMLVNEEDFYDPDDMRDFSL